MLKMTQLTTNKRGNYLVKFVKVNKLFNCYLINSLIITILLN